MWAQYRAAAGGMLASFFKIYEACSICQSYDPFTFLVWSFVIMTLVFTVLTALPYRRMGALSGLWLLLWLGSAVCRLRESILAV